MGDLIWFGGFGWISLFVLELWMGLLVSLLLAWVIVSGVGEWG